jgi:3-isopropylmalate dehydratase small subunit
VPATNEIWNECLSEGLIDVFKKSGAMVSNAGCAGCAAGQVGQNGQGEITISSGNRNFTGKQGKGSEYLASPAIVAASAIAGFITDPANIPHEPAVFKSKLSDTVTGKQGKKTTINENQFIDGRAFIIPRDNIDTDMIFHNRYLTITNMNEMGKLTFDNLSGFEDFATKAKKGDIIITGKNFGCGSSRQQAVDCFISLGINAIIAESFGSIYERNAINAAFPVITLKSAAGGFIKNGDQIRIDLKTGEIKNLTNGEKIGAEPFSEVQFEIYRRGGLLS